MKVGYHNVLHARTLYSTADLDRSDYRYRLDSHSPTAFAGRSLVGAAGLRSLLATSRASIAAVFPWV